MTRGAEENKMKAGNRVQRFAKGLTKKALNSTLFPAIRYSVNPLIVELASRFDLAAEKVGRQCDEASSRLADQVNRAASQLELRSNAANNERQRETQTLLRDEIAQLRARIAIDTPENPCIHGFKAYAQTDEDGIIENILQRVPGHSKTFMEIGCGNGLENNTHYLALQGYRGCWVDGGKENIASIEEALGGTKFENLLVERYFITKDNIGQIIVDLCAFVGTKEPGFFSLDIDGNDLHVLSVALTYFQPIAICVEYNAKFPPPTVAAMKYDANYHWAGDDYHGASLQAFCDLLEGYKLVASNLSGVNAFFVRRDCASSFADYTPQQLYQPFRENLIDLRAEHKPSLRWLRDVLR